MVFNELHKSNPNKLNEFLEIWSKNIQPNLRNKYFTKYNLFLKIKILEAMYMTIMIIIKNFV